MPIYNPRTGENEPDPVDVTDDTERELGQLTGSQTVGGELRTPVFDPAVRQAVKEMHLTLREILQTLKER